MERWRKHYPKSQAVVRAQKGIAEQVGSTGREEGKPWWNLRYAS